MRSNYGCVYFAGEHGFEELYSQGEEHPHQRAIGLLKQNLNLQQINHLNISERRFFLQTQSKVFRNF